MSERKQWPPPVDPAVGIVCRGCGCANLRVVYVRHKMSFTFRLRECRYCGRRVQTKEEAK